MNYFFNGYFLIFFLIFLVYINIYFLKVINMLFNKGDFVFKDI